MIYFNGCLCKVLLLDGRAKFYELSILPAGSGGGLNSFRAQTMPFPMASMDFTVDLTCEDSLEAVMAAEREGVLDPVLCKFKPCAGAFTGKDLVSIPRQTKTTVPLASRVMLDDSSMAEEPRRPQTLPVPSTSPERPGYTQPKSDSFTPTTASPPPPSQVDDLLFVAPGACSSLLSAAKQEQQAQVAGQGEAHLPCAAILSSSALEMGVPPDSLRYSFPAEVIVAQQRQIEMLQKQVLDLHNLLRTLTASSSTGHQACDASAMMSDLRSISPNSLPAPAPSASGCISSSFQPLPPEAPVSSSTTGKGEEQSVQEKVVDQDKLPLPVIKGENTNIDDCLPEQGSMSLVLETQIQQEQLQEEEDFDDDDTFSRLPSCLIEPRSEIETEVSILPL